MMATWSRLLVRAHLQMVCSWQDIARLAQGWVISTYAHALHGRGEYHLSIDLVTYFEDAANHPADSLPTELKRYFSRNVHQGSLQSALPADVRKHVRRKFNETLLAIRVDENDQPCGQFFQIFVRDISAGGLGFIHTRAFSHERLAVQLMGYSRMPIIMVGKVVRCVCRHRAYEVGMQFQSRAIKGQSVKNPEPLEEIDPFGTKPFDQISFRNAPSNTRSI